jgi:hypothetical protein
MAFALPRGVTPLDGSYRDPDARLADAGGRLLRLLDEKGAADWERLAESSLFADAQADGSMVATHALDPDDWPVALLGGEQVAAVLEHERLPDVSPPAEWTFGMLQAATLLHLDLLQRAGAEGLTLKDGNAANITFVGHRPVFLDVGSFERHRGEPWPGYRQLCSTMLNPLLVEAHLGVPCQRWLRSVDGLPPAEAASLLRGRGRWHRGVTTHVTLHARAERRMADRPPPTRRTEVPAAVTTGLAKRLHRIVADLEPRGRPSGWVGYTPRSHYDSADLLAKDRFVAEVVARRRPTKVLDLGTNDGRYARLAARHAPVTAVDSDAVTVDRLYRSLVADPPAHPVTPLVVDLLDPTPPAGWDLQERSGFWERQRPDLVLALALVHHLCISGNVPPELVVDRLRALDAPLVLEVPHHDDVMVQRLLTRKRPDQHADFTVERWGQLLLPRFHTADRLELRSRTLLLLVPRGEAQGPPR